jgi:Holliday junction resolvase RusA-like endonuclease
MTQAITIEITGLPIAQPRPKVSTRGGFARAYIDAKHPIHAYRDAIALTWRSAIGKPFEGPLKVEITFRLAKPKACKRVYPTVRPDIDNYIKGVFDALNGKAWSDDGQVVEVIARKRYGPAKTTISVESFVDSESEVTT